MAAGCAVCGMPHRTNAHLKVVNSVGGYVGGTRATRSNRVPPDREEQIQARNQTSFSDWGPVYPNPQSIKDMPYQVAGYDDDYSKRGQIASTEGQRYWLNDWTDDFLNKVTKVYINPAYKKDYNNVGNDPDSAEYVSNYKGPMPIHRMEKLQNLAQGINAFASATSKYFNKDVEVLPYPDMYPKNAGNHQTTARIDVAGFEEFATDDSLRNIRAGYVSGLWPTFGPKVKKTGKETYRVVGPQSTQINMNTNMPDRVYKVYPDSSGKTMLHEFGHSLGINHPKGYDDGGAQNSIMSYSSTSWSHGTRLQPADVNLYKDLYKEYDVRRRGRSAYKGVAKKRK